ncbi:helix-turn-helix domain-containing protein [Streptomyces yanii]|uniref:Helix-turn-helix domain-containing protein n=1 Tax=Streptomyces yanii TaxID=78510 RepID=A0ABV5R8D4_9ACTN
MKSAESAFEWVELLGDVQAMVHHEDVAHLRLLSRVALDIGEELRDVSTRIAEGVRYNLRHGTALSTTRETYSDNRCSAADTAHELYIHRNTLRQRLARIEVAVCRDDCSGSSGQLHDRHLVD